MNKETLEKANVLNRLIESSKAVINDLETKSETSLVLNRPGADQKDAFIINSGNSKASDEDSFSLQLDVARDIILKREKKELNRLLKEFETL